MINFVLFVSVESALTYIICFLFQAHGLQGSWRNNIGWKKLFQLGHMYNNKVYIVHKIYVFYKYEKNICRRKFII
jgi:hypothetical protein